MKKILIAALVAIFALTGCQKHNETPEGSSAFADVKQYGLYSKADPTYVYNIDNHQYSVKAAPTYRFVMQTDDQKAYLSATMQSLPTDLNALIDVDITLEGADGFKNGVRKMKLVKLEVEKAWLWSDDESIGVVVAVPIY